MASRASDRPLQGRAPGRPLGHRPAERDGGLQVAETRARPLVGGVFGEHLPVDLTRAAGEPLPQVELGERRRGQLHRRSRGRSGGGRRGGQRLGGEVWRGGRRTRCRGGGGRRRPSVHGVGGSSAGGAARAPCRISACGARDRLGRQAFAPTRPTTRAIGAVAESRRRGSRRSCLRRRAGTGSAAAGGRAGSAGGAAGLKAGGSVLTKADRSGTTTLGTVGASASGPSGGAEARSPHRGGRPRQPSAGRDGRFALDPRRRHRRGRQSWCGRCGSRAGAGRMRIVGSDGDGPATVRSGARSGDADGWTIRCVGGGGGTAGARRGRAGRPGGGLAAAAGRRGTAPADAAAEAPPAAWAP